MNAKAIVLRKLLQHGALDPDEARVICGWPDNVFRDALQAALACGLVEWVRHPSNQHLNHIGAEAQRPARACATRAAA